MNIQNKRAFEYNIKMAPLMEDASAPLQEYLGIKKLCYARFYNNGDFFRLENEGAWTEQFFKNGFYNDAALFTKQIQKVPEGKYFSFIITGKPEGKHLTLLHSFKYWHILHIYKKYPNFTELFAFSADVYDSEVLNVYLNESHLLRQFIGYFKAKYQDILHADENNLIKSDLKIGNEVRNSDIGLLESFKIDKFYIDEMCYLTQRELECAKELVLGSATKEIAAYLNISPRTAETYINCIKVKTNCHFKSQLIKKLISMGVMEI